MRRLSGLFESIVALRNLWAGWLDFRSGKRRRPSVRAFEFDADRQVVRLHRALRSGTWRPGMSRLRLIHEPKRRLIAAAPVADRVVHHAVYRVLAPRLDQGLMEHTYACLPGRGSHRALLAFQRALRCHRYVLALDIRHYFLSIDRDILLGLMARRLKEPPLLKLLEHIADGGEGLYRRPAVRQALGLPLGFPPQGCGLPIGNLTSQWWGNHYLSGLDHHIKRELKIPHAQRYMDDVTLFSDDKQQLNEARIEISEWLWRERRLHLKRPGAEVGQCSRHHLYLGHLVARDAIRPGPAMLRRARHRLASQLLDEDPERFQRSLSSYRGILLGPVPPPAAGGS